MSKSNDTLKSFFLINSNNSSKSLFKLRLDFLQLSPKQLITILYNCLFLSSLRYLFSISYLRYPKDVFVTLEPRVESRHFLNAPLELYDESRDNFDAHSNTDVPQVIYGDSDDSDDDMEPSFKARTI